MKELYISLFSSAINNLDSDKASFYFTEKSPNQDVHFAYHSFGRWWNYSLNCCFDKKLK